MLKKTQWRKRLSSLALPEFRFFCYFNDLHYSTPSINLQISQENTCVENTLRNPCTLKNLKNLIKTKFYFDFYNYDLDELF